MDACALCLENKPLRDSHVIPRSFFQKIKNGQPQLVKLTNNLNIPPVMDNANWNEPLLCGDCEHFLNSTYESSQLSFFRNYKSVTKSHGKLTYHDLNFNKFYIMWLSILWRASESKISAFGKVDLGSDVNELIRKIIVSENTNIHGVDITDIIKIGLTRITPQAGMKEDVARKMLTSPLLEETPSGFNFYFMVEGFLVLYIFSPLNEHSLPPHFGEIKRSRFLRIPKVEIQQSKHATRLFNDLIAIANKHPKWR